MVYLTDSYLDEIIKSCGLDKKYPIIAVPKEKGYLIGTMSSFFNRSSEYQRSARTFLSKCNVFRRSTNNNPTANTNFDTHLEQNSHLKMYHPFIVYHKTDLKNFSSVAFLEKFCGKSIDILLPIFNKRLSMASDIPYLVRTSSIINASVVKILEKHLIVTLARFFSIIETAINLGTLEFVEHEFLFYISRTYNERIRGCISKSLDVHSMISLDTNLADSIEEWIEDYGIKSSMATILKYIVGLHDTYKRIYDFFLTRTIEENIDFCEKNPDFNIAIGTYFTGSRTKINPFVFLKQLVTYQNLFLNNLILMNPSLCPEKENVIDLKMPSFVRPAKKVITIEV